MTWKHGSLGAAPCFLVAHRSSSTGNCCTTERQGLKEHEAGTSLGAGSRVVCVQEGGGGVVLEQRLQEHADGAKDTDEDKDPEEQAVDHHGDILPVLTHLNRRQRRPRYQSHDAR